MIRNEYRERWAKWLPPALDALAKDPPDFAAAMPQMPLPEISKAALVHPSEKFRVALISSSGAYDPRLHAPFVASSIVGDPTHRILDIDTPADQLQFAHEHFDHVPAKSDLECIIPRQTLRTFDVNLTAHLISWTGYLLDWPTFIEATIPQILKQVQANGGNTALIVPI
jgi:hypothetical protein